MDSAHTALVSLVLRADGFAKFRCDRNLSMGMHLGSLAKIMKCANNEDTLTMWAQDDADKVNMTIQSSKEVWDQLFIYLSLVLWIVTLIL